MFEPGWYYVGDLCYVIPGKEWSQFSDYVIANPNDSFEYGGHLVWSGDTKYGDGLYHDQDGYAYGVDAGIIGVCPIALADEGELQDTVNKELGRVVEFKEPFTCQNHDGLIVIGSVEIETGDIEV